MKTIARLIVALTLGLALFIVPAHATTKQVTNVGASASTIFTPSGACLCVVIQNNGSGDVRIVFDGGTITYGKSDPTASTGYLLKAGTYVIFGYGAAQNPRPVIRAILVTGTTTTLDIVSADPSST